MTTAPITHRYIARLLLALAFALLLPACGRSVTVTVVDERSGTPIADAQVVHERPEWRMMGILPRLLPINHGYGQTDAHGQILFKDVRDDDLLTVDGRGVERRWFRPLWPVTKTRTGPDTKAADQYQRLNADTPPYRLTLPASQERQP